MLSDEICRKFRIGFAASGPMHPIHIPDGVQTSTVAMLLTVRLSYVIFAFAAQERHGDFIAASIIIVGRVQWLMNVADEMHQYT
jgi:hypothetical protein